MKIIAVFGIALLSLAACKSKKSVEPDDTLPKDISQKPVKNNSQEKDNEDLSKLRAEIDDLINAQTCTNAEDWRISPIGSKACGGPASYLAYPKDKEDDILPKIQKYTRQQSAFNQKYGIVSDCMMVMPPSGVKCENGKAVLISSNESIQ
ncbi:hypothetical protein [uncultured Chryseobacterium sp.]|uniref:hypothetical protein n=1 Tax=uncultured Chryseobacterium sp. TaxID=259322 RepID=UPI0026290644|nr:hypothetical protein [uncultured Chryseobacterium sp.]